MDFRSFALGFLAGRGINPGRLARLFRGLAMDAAKKSAVTDWTTETINGEEVKGVWRTTELGHKIFIDESGTARLGNKETVAIFNGEKEAPKRGKMSFAKSTKLGFKNLDARVIRDGTSGVSMSYSGMKKKNGLEYEGELHKNDKGTVPALKVASIKPDKSVFGRKNISSFKGVPKQTERLMSQIPETGKYFRGDPIDYKGKKPPEGMPVYNWMTKDGKGNATPVTADEAFRVEGALREFGETPALDKTNSGVEVRRDLYNGRGQLYMSKKKHSLDPFSNCANAEEKAQRVTEIREKQEKLLDSIERDMKDGSDAAYMAYFMHRTRCRVGTSDEAKGRGAAQLPVDAFTIDGDRIRVDFRAKNGYWHIDMTDPTLAAYMRERIKQTPEGDRGRTRMFGTSAASESKYLHKISGEAGLSRDLMPHDFRRVAATNVVAKHFADNQKWLDSLPDSEKAAGYDKIRREAVGKAAKALNDEPGIVVGHYITPAVLFPEDKELARAYLRNFSGLGSNERDSYATE